MATATPVPTRVEICSHTFRGVSRGDRLVVSAESKDKKFTANGDLALDGTVVVRWTHAQIMSGTAKHVFAAAGIYVCMVDIVYFGGPSAMTLKFSILRPDGSQHSVPKVCNFTGNNKEIDNALVTINVK